MHLRPLPKKVFFSLFFHWGLSALLFFPILHWGHFGFWKIFFPTGSNARFVGFDSFVAIILVMTKDVAKQTL